MQIAVCDDIQKEREQVRAALDTYTKAHLEYFFDIDEYRSADDVLQAVQAGKIYDIALLDIVMPDSLGTDVAEKMLAKNPDMSVVFLTSSDEFAVKAFAMNAVHYLLKPFSQEQFAEALDRAVRKTQEQDFLSLACVDGMYRISVHEITFIESQNHYLMVHLSSGGTLRLRGKLSQMFDEIREYPEFIRLGASYIANLTYVRRVTGKTLEIINSVHIPIPRRSSGEVKKAYMDYCRKEAWK